VAGRDDTDSLDRFRDWYHLDAPVLTQIERAVLASDYKANGYTTREQADELGQRLQLVATDRLLDLGTGCGWPGLYLAVTTGCSVVASDIPLEGLAQGVRRASSEHLGSRAGLVAARGEALPFRRRSFDAIVHTDALC
jgi:ubiquinone/menaquinone biosynthesis C-methylase UbiE